MTDASSSRSLLHQLTLRNLLSFGPSTTVTFGPLNVLIGPNGSGKSNMIEALALLRKTPDDIRPVVARGGGVAEWIWKGSKGGVANLDAVFENPHWSQPLRHVLSFREESQAIRLTDERIENEKPTPGKQDPYFYYRFQQGRPVLNTQSGGQRELARETVAADLSILAQRKDPELYPEVSYLASLYASVRVYREWTFGRTSVFREPQRADARSDRLEEDFSNLGLFLNRLRRNPPAKKALLTALVDLYEGLTDFDVSIDGGTVQVFFTEGDFTVPATRLSDGTLRYLCLLAILCDPSPPPLICIEEPELGLHPDIIPKVADLLRAAAARTQLIVTTHSDILVDAMSDQPEAILITEKHEGSTSVRRLDAASLSDWLMKYKLGELWTRGELGGMRW